MTAPHPEPVELLALADGELDQDALARVAAHVEGCALCTREIDELRTIEGMLATAAVTRTPSGTNGDLAERMQDATRTLLRRSSPRRVAWFLAAAAAALLGTFAYWLTRDAGVFLRATVDWTRTEGRLRGPGDRCHFDLELAAPGEVTVFAVAKAGEVTLWFPADDAAVPRLAMPLPLPAGSTRLPADPLFDFEAGSPLPLAFVLVVRTNPPTAAEREAWRQDLTRAAAGAAAGRMARIAVAVEAWRGVVCALPD